MVGTRAGVCAFALAMMLAITGLVFAAAARADTPIEDVACAAPKDCIAVTNHAEVLTTTNARSAHPMWRMQKVGPDPLYSVACTGTALCLAVDEDSYTFAATNPFRAGAEWAKQHSAGLEDAGSVSCAGGDFCAVFGTASLSLAFRPNAGLTWTSPDLRPGEVSNEFDYASGPLVCTVRDTCLVANAGGGIVIAPDVTATTLKLGSANWYASGTDDALACTPLGTNCIAGDSHGRLAFGSGPQMLQWREQGAKFGRLDLEAASCPTETDCLLAGGSSVLTSTDAFVSGAKFALHTVDPEGGLLGADCPDASTCFLFDRHGQILRVARPFTRRPSVRVIRAAPS